MQIFLCSSNLGLGESSGGWKFVNLSASGTQSWTQILTQLTIPGSWLAEDSSRHSLKPCNSPGSLTAQQPSMPAAVFLGLLPAVSSLLVAGPCSVSPLLVLVPGSAPDFLLLVPSPGSCTCYSWYSGSGLVLGLGVCILTMALILGFWLLAPACCLDLAFSFWLLL